MKVAQWRKKPKWSDSQVIKYLDVLEIWAHRAWALAFSWSPAPNPLRHDSFRATVLKHIFVVTKDRYYEFHVVPGRHLGLQILFTINTHWKRDVCEPAKSRTQYKTWKVFYSNNQSCEMCWKQIPGLLSLSINLTEPRPAVTQCIECCRHWISVNGRT